MNIKKTIPALAIVLLLCAGWLFYLLFVPRSYNTIRLQKKDNTRRWQLSTGSLIAYTLITANGQKKESPVIYLHGGPGAGITDLEIQTLRNLSYEGYDIYLYDQVGCGYSSRLRNINEYSAERHLRDLEAIVDSIGADQVILIGQSWGAILGSIYIADHPDKVEKFVVTAPAALQPIDPKYASIPPPDSLTLRPPTYKFVEPKNMRSRAIEFWLRRLDAKLATDAEADEYATYSTNLLNKTMVCDTANAVRATGTEGYYVHYKTRMSLGKMRDRRDALKNCRLPVLVMKAQCDNQPWGFTQEYLDVFAVHQFRFMKDAGHNIFVEQPEEYVKEIADFIK